MAFAGKLTQAQEQDILILKGANMLRSLNGRAITNETILQCICYLNATASHVLFKRLPGCEIVDAQDPRTNFAKSIRCEDRRLERPGRWRPQILHRRSLAAHGSWRHSGKSDL